MTLDTEEFAARLATQLHASLDAVPIVDSPLRTSLPAMRRRNVVRRRRFLAAGAAVAVIAASVAAIVVSGGSRGHFKESVTPAQQPLRVLASVDVGGTTPPEIAVGAGYVFAALWDSGRLVRLDEKTLRPAGSLAVGSQQNGPLSIAFGDGSLWLLNFSDGRLWRIDPSSLRPTMKIRLGAEPSKVAYGDGSVWVTVCCGTTSTASRQRLLRIDPRTGHTTGTTVIPGDGETVNLAVGPQILVSSANAGPVVVDPVSMRIERRLHAGCDGCEGAQGVAVGEGGLFVASFGSVLRFEASTGKFDAESPQVGVDSNTATPLTLAPDGLWLSTEDKLVRLAVTGLRVTESTSVPAAAQLVVAEPWLYASVAGKVLRLGTDSPPTGPSETP